MSGCLHEAGLTSDRPDFSHFSFCLQYMRLALTVRLNYGSIMAVNSMKFNGVRPAQNIQFGLAGDLRLGQDETESQAGLMYSVNNLQEKQYIRI